MIKYEIKPKKTIYKFSWYNILQKQEIKISKGFLMVNIIAKLEDDLSGAPNKD